MTIPATITLPAHVVPLQRWLQEQVSAASRQGEDSAEASVRIGDDFIVRYPKVEVVELFLILDPLFEEWEIKVRFSDDDVHIITQPEKTA